MWIISKENSFIVECKKERRSSSCDGLSIEQTMCKIKVIDSKYIKQVKDKKKMKKSEWISFCVEGYGQDEVEKILKVSKSVESILNEYDEDYIIASYPGWLIELLF